MSGFDTTRIMMNRPHNMRLTGDNFLQDAASLVVFQGGVC